MAREGLMDDTGYHGFDYECPEKPKEEICYGCMCWNSKGNYCEKEVKTMKNTFKDKVNNVPKYAWDKEVWVVRADDSNGSLWYYGAWDQDDIEKAVAAAIEVNGIVIQN